jgi:predicted nucleic acid-binding protein
MRYLIDSDYVADYLVAKPHTTELLPTLAQEGIGISLITVGEIYEGIYYGRDPQKTEEVFLRFMRIARPLALTSKIIQQFAQIRGALRRKGQIIGNFDILIAATAICHHLTLVTRNTKDYERIPGLQLYKIS